MERSQFAILVHALCWVHMERTLRRLNGLTVQHRQEIEEVQNTLWTYYHELKANPRAANSPRKDAIRSTQETKFLGSATPITMQGCFITKKIKEKRS